MSGCNGLINLNNVRLEVYSFVLMVFVDVCPLVRVGVSNRG